MNITSDGLDFNHLKQYLVSWESEKDNQLQMLHLHKFAVGDDDKLTVFLSPNARSFLFDSNIGSLSQGITAVSIENINYARIDNIFVYAKVESYMDEISKQIFND